QIQTDDSGDLILIGSGDPTINGETMQQWTQSLKDQGITSINGDLIGDDTYFDDQRRGAGWSWDDLEWYYAAEISALQYNENAFTVTIHATTPEQPTTVELVPQTDYVKIQNATSSAAGVDTKVDWNFDQLTN